MTKKVIRQVKKALSMSLTAVMVVMTVPEDSIMVSAAESSVEAATELETSETETAEIEHSETEIQTTETEHSETEIQITETQTSENESVETNNSEDEYLQETENQTETESGKEETQTEETEPKEIETEEQLGYSSSEDFEIDSGKLVKYTGNDTEVTIPDEVTIIGKEAFKGNTTIQSITLPSNLQEIEESAFEGVPLGDKINGEATGTLTIPGTVTNIGYMAFRDCSGLREITFENGSANSLEIRNSWAGVSEYGVFSNCKNLKKITLPVRLARIGTGAFSGCISLEEVVFGGSEKEIGKYAFMGCKALKTTELPGSVEKIEDEAFYDCTGLSDVKLNNGLLTIGRFAFENAPLGIKTDGEATGKLTVPATVTYIGYRAFKGCSNLREVEFENGTGNESRLELENGEGPFVYDRGVFSDCRNLKKVTLPDRLERIGSAAFKGNCTSLEEVVFGKNLREIGECAFQGCTALKSVKLPSNVETIESSAFLDCKSLSEVTFNKGLMTIAYSAFENVPFGKKESGEIIGGELVIPGSVIKIEYRAFMNCSYLKEVLFENGSASVLEIEDSIRGAINRKDWGAFAGCENMKKVTLPDRLTRVGSGAFYGCTNLEEVSFGANLREIGKGSFGECKALRAVKLPGNVETIEDEVFLNCTSMLDLTLNRGLMTIGRSAFENAPLGTKENGLTLTIPGSVTSIGYCAFKECKNLRKIVFEDGSASRLIIEDRNLSEDTGVFSGCENLKNVVLPERLEVIGSSAFFGCKNLEEIVFGKNLKQIKTCALKGCTSLRTIELPNVVETIEGEAFSGCSNLTKVVFNNGLETIGERAFQNVPFGTKDEYGKLIVPGTVRTVSAGAFEGCAYLQEVVFADGNALDITLDNSGYGIFQEGVFYDCPELKNITFPNRMELIKSKTACKCPKLENVFIPEHVTTIEENAFDNCGEFTIWGRAGSAAQTYAEQYDNITFRDVEGQDNKVTGVSVTPDKITKTVKDAGEKVQLIVSIEPAWAADKSVSFKTSNESVAAVDEKGEVTIAGEGSADITVTTKDGGKTAVCKVIVSKEESSEKVTGVSVTPDKITKTVKDAGTKVLLTVSIEPAGAADQSVSFKTSNENVAAVDEKGEVTIIGEGSAEITVTTNDGGKTAVCEVLVLKEELEGQTDEKPLINSVLFPKSKSEYSAVYTGEQIRPAMIVAYRYKDANGNAKTQKLKLNVDYTVRYSNNTNTGENTARVTVRGIGEYTGIITREFTITPKSIKGVTLSPVGDIVFGEKPSVRVTDGTKELVEGRDYNIKLSTTGSASADTQSVLTVEGIGNYMGTSKKSVKFNILKTETDIHSIASESILVKFKNPAKRYTYNGKAQKPGVVVTDTTTGKKISSSMYKVIYSNNINAGKGTAKAWVIGISKKGKGYYGISEPLYFDINQKNFKNVSASMSGTIPKTGTIEDIKTAIKEAVIVKDAKHVLSGDEYIIDYGNIKTVDDIKIGTKYQITLEPKADGNYIEGSQKTIKIKFGQLNLASKTANISVKITNASKNEIELRYNGILLEKDRDYTATVKKEKNKSTYTVKIKAVKKSAYKGSRTFKNVQFNQGTESDPVDPNIKPAVSNNKDAQNYRWYNNYNWNWADTVKSYLFENQSGGLTRVEYINGEIVAEDYDDSFKLRASRKMPMELSIWGGFYAGDKYNFIIFGQENPSQDDNTEVVRVVKYSKDWQRLGEAKLCGANTVVPFDAGSLRCVEYGDYLYIRTCHKMYASSDGLNHQANMTLTVCQSDMTITDSFYKVMNSSVGYVSHSFNQFVLVDRNQNLVTLDHGDAYPRGIVLMRPVNAKAGGDKFSGTFENSELLTFSGAIGNNQTDASVGGFAETENGYVAAFNYDGTSSGGARAIYLGYTSKSGLDSKVTPLTAYDGLLTPVLAPVGLDGGYLMWTDSKGKFYYTRYADGGTIGTISTADASLSDCQPILHNGEIVWYVTQQSVPAFFKLDVSSSKISKIEAK